jgi:hypothetical protein
MLLIDGVKYEAWIPPSEDEFERVVKEHTQDIFGEQSIYIDRKQKLKSLAGIGSIPDGYVIAFRDSPEWHIVEMELSSHPLYEHIVSQIGRFVNGISNPNILRGIVNAIDSEITGDEFLRLRLKKAVEPTEIYRFLSDLISKPPILTVIIEKDTEELREALNTLRYPLLKVVGFQTFTRLGAEAVHAHLFEPLYKGTAPVRNKLISTKDEDTDGLSIFIKVENFWIKYKRLRISTEYLKDLSLSHDTSFELETDVGIIKTKIDKWNEICTGMGKWYKAHPGLKAGDTVTFKVLEPMKRYRLEISK